MNGDAKDASGNGNDGVVKGAIKWVDDGMEGKALLCEGGRIEVPASATFDTPAMTCAFWMRPSRDLKADDPRMNIVYLGIGPMFSYNKAPGAGEPEGPAGTIRSWADTDGAISKGTLFTKNDQWKGGVWYHLAVTYDLNELAMYEDGIETGRVPLNGAINSRATRPIQIGQAFPGTIDEVKLYDRGLSGAEVGLAAGPAALEAHGKLTSTWGELKLGF